MVEQKPPKKEIPVEEQSVEELVKARMETLSYMVLSELMGMSLETGISVNELLLDFLSNTIDTVQAAEVYESLSKAYAGGEASNKDVYFIASHLNIRPMAKKLLFALLQRDVPFPEEEEEDEEDSKGSAS